MSDPNTVSIDSDCETKRHLRGSSLMLVGRMLAILINFATQLVIVRALAQEDYGAFAYALSVLLIGVSISKLGMDKALSRFTPIYLEQGEKKRAAGIVVFVLGGIALIGSLLVAIVWLFQGQLSSFFNTDPLATTILVFLAILAPIEALENALEKLLAIFSKPKSLFFRRHVLGPSLKLMAALPILVFSSDVMTFVWLYLIARVFGVSVSVWMVMRSMIQNGVSKHLFDRTMLPAKEVLGFSIPLLSNDVALALRTSMVTLIIQFFHSAAIVAVYRAVVPVARLNRVVTDSFKLLYSPAAARLYARDDRDGLESLYWNNSAWIALLTFPVFILTFAFAQPLTELMFGARYAESGRVLCWLALGTYVNACFGFSGVTLRILGHVRVLVVNDLFGAALALTLNLILIPRYGAIGAAVGVCIANIVQNVMLQILMFRLGALKTISYPVLKVYASIAGASIFVQVVQSWDSGSLVLALIVTVLSGWIVLRWNAKSLGLNSIFPELQRLAPFRLILGLN